MSYKQNNWKALEELAASAADAAQTINEFFNALREAKEQLEAERADFVALCKTKRKVEAETDAFIKSISESCRDATALQEDDFWIPVSEPPKESGPVVVCGIIEGGRISYISNMNYSAKHNAFNCMDWYDSPSEVEIRPSFWKPLPKRVEDLRIRAPKGE